MEIWKDVEGYKGFYQASTAGRVKSLTRKIMRSNGTEQTFKERILADSLDSRGYVRYTLSVVGKSKIIQGHRLIAGVFLSNPENKPQVNHKNGIKTDNRMENLEWCTASENVNHAWNSGIATVTKKMRLSNAKLKKEEVMKIRKLYYSMENQSTSQKTRKYTRKTLSNIYKVSMVAIDDILTGKTWKNI